ncbi:MAG: insulinase family protein, partial [Gammaproteobacteria bacterium]
MSKPFVTTSHAGLSRVRRMLLLGLLLAVGACQQTPSDAGRAPVAAPPPPTDGLAVEPGLSSGTAAEVGLSSGKAAATATVRQSPNDNRRYRYRTLANGLRVLLVSDPDTDKAAASLVVFRGSHHDPAEYPGLAHFLEHMLFIGTEKYPEVDAYQHFIGQHGGSSNAYTAGDHTNYFFDIQPAYFEAGMDRFAQFFIAPLLAADYVEREKNAVHSEYQMQLRADNWRANAVLGVALSPKHPEARFNIGSLDTLGDGVDAALRTFLQTHYSADQMALVALSNEPL